MALSADVAKKLTGRRKQRAAPAAKPELATEDRPRTGRRRKIEEPEQLTPSVEPVAKAAALVDWLPLFLQFISRLVIESKETGQTVLGDHLWGSQHRALTRLGDGLARGIRSFTYLKSRQIGVTTIFLAVDLFWLFMHPGIHGVLVTDDEGNRDKFRLILRQYSRGLPRNMRYEIVDDNKAFMSWNVRGKLSVLDFLVAGKRRGSSLGTSRAYRFAHVTEVSKYGDERGLESFLQTLSETHPDRLFIYESTAEGFNHFYRMWLSAKTDRETQMAIFIGWWARADQQIAKDDPRYKRYMDDPWDEEESELREIVAREYGVLVTNEQLAWYRWRSETRSLDEGMMMQEQPWCVTRETRVGTARGIIRIADIQVGDEATLCNVLAVGATGVAPIWKAQTRLGYQICGTANHPLITSDGVEIELSKSMGAVVRLLCPKFASLPYTVRWRHQAIDYAIAITTDLARLVGLYMGDGCIRFPSLRAGAQFKITCNANDIDVVEECERLIYAVFGLITQRRVVSGKNGGYIDVQVTSRDICETFRMLGLTRNDTGPTMRKVHVPEFIFRSPQPIVREFLIGLFEADGFNAFKTNRVVLFSKYPAFLQSVQLLLLGFGITSKVTSRPKMNSSGFTYIGHELSLRASEARSFNAKIGFISRRKRERSKKPLPCHPEKTNKRVAAPIVMHDNITTVENTGTIAEVFNLTVSGTHWYDANGIVTHNTERQAFVLSGRSFFPLRKVERDLAVVQDGNSVTFTAYRYYLGKDFASTQIEQVYNLRDCELRVWEEPLPWARYVIGCDPAYGRSDWNDSHAISIYRCFADKLVQVAEYGSTDPETFQVTWALAHLASRYEDCYVNFEVSGPGIAIKTELDRMRQILRSQAMTEVVKAKDWQHVLDGIKWYLYHRPDSLGKGFAYGWKTTVDNKIAIMNELRDSYTNDILIVRSSNVLEQMQYIVQDGADIGPAAKGRSHDDFVFSTAFAHRAWLEWVRPMMIEENYTYARAMLDDADRMSGQRPSMTAGIVASFFKDKEKERRDRQNNPWGRELGLR